MQTYQKFPLVEEIKIYLITLFTRRAANKQDC